MCKFTSKIKRNLSKYAQQKYSVHLFDALLADIFLEISTIFIELFAFTYERNVTVFFF